MKTSSLHWFIAAFAALFLLVGLTVAVNYFGMFQSSDNAILQFLSNARGSALTPLFFVFTFLGKPSFVLAATAIVALVLLLKKKFFYSLLFFGTIFGDAAFAFLLKILVHRPRPTLFSPLVQENYFSFPSGHATLAIAFFGLLAYLAAGTAKTRVARISIFFIWLFFVFNIGLSRLYLGAHYPTDVMAGYFLGLFFLCMGVGLFEQLAKKIPE